MIQRKYQPQIKTFNKRFDTFGCWNITFMFLQKECFIELPLFWMSHNNWDSDCMSMAIRLVHYIIYKNESGYISSKAAVVKRQGISKLLMFVVLKQHDHNL